MGKKETPAVQGSAKDIGGLGDLVKVSQTGDQSESKVMGDQVGASAGLESGMPNGDQVFNTTMVGQEHPDTWNLSPIEEIRGSTESTLGLEVISTRDGFRRAGRAWTTKPTFVPLADLSDDQVEQLFSEPNLMVIQSTLPLAAQ